MRRRGPSPGVSAAATSSSWPRLGLLPGNGVRVWWQLDQTGDATKARAVRDALDGVISNKLDGLFGVGHQPLPDGGSTKLCRGGSDDLDISLVDLGGDKGDNG